MVQTGTIRRTKLCQKEQDQSEIQLPCHLYFEKEGPILDRKLVNGFWHDDQLAKLMLNGWKHVVMMTFMKQLLYIELLLKGTSKIQSFKQDKARAKNVDTAND